MSAKIVPIEEWRLAEQRAGEKLPPELKVMFLVGKVGGEEVTTKPIVRISPQCDFVTCGSLWFVRGGEIAATDTTRYRLGSIDPGFERTGWTRAQALQFLREHPLSLYERVKRA